MQLTFRIEAWLSLFENTKSKTVRSAEKNENRKEMIIVCEIGYIQTKMYRI